MVSCLTGSGKWQLKDLGNMHVEFGVYETEGLAVKSKHIVVTMVTDMQGTIPVDLACYCNCLEYYLLKLEYCNNYKLQRLGTVAT